MSSNSTGSVSLQYQFFQDVLFSAWRSVLTEVFDHQYWDKGSRRLSWLIMWRAMRDLWTKRQGGFRKCICQCKTTISPVRIWNRLTERRSCKLYTNEWYFSFCRQSYTAIHFAIWICGFGKQVAVDPVESSKILQLCNSVEVTWLRLIEVGYQHENPWTFELILEAFEEVTQRGDRFCFLLI